MPCPIHYTAKERGENQAEANVWQDNEDTIAELEKLLCANREGFVYPEDYKAVQAVARKFWEKLAAHGDPGVQILRELWPWGRS